MTQHYLRPAIAAAIALILAGCGGTAKFDIAGTVVGLTYDGLVLTTNGMDTSVKATGATTTFKFPNQLSYGEVYKVSVKSDPRHQTCTVASFPDANGIFYTGPSDTAGRLATINIGVSCAVDAFLIGGKITGLTADGLTLINGSFDTYTPPAVVAGTTGDIDFTFSRAVPFDSTYGVTVLTQPTNQFCTVTNGAGVMKLERSADPAAVVKITNIQVDCVAI
jgi:hypothetical protein